MKKLILTIFLCINYQISFSQLNGFTPEFSIHWEGGPGLNWMHSYQTKDLPEGNIIFPFNAVRYCSFFNIHVFPYPKWSISSEYISYQMDMSYQIGNIPIKNTSSRFLRGVSSKVYYSLLKSRKKNFDIYAGFGYAWLSGEITMYQKEKPKVKEYFNSDVDFLFHDTWYPRKGTILLHIGARFRKELSKNWYYTFSIQGINSLYSVLRTQYTIQKDSVASYLVGRNSGSICSFSAAICRKFSLRKYNR